MLVELKIKTKVRSESSADGLYCVIYNNFPSLFEIFEEEDFIYRFGRVSVKWSGELDNTKKINIKVFRRKLEDIFCSSGLKKCRYGITANGENYEYIFTKRKKEFLNENYKQRT